MPKSHNRAPAQNPNRVRQVIGGATMGMLAVLAVVASRGGHKEQYDPDTEAALQQAIRPTMVRMAEKATGFAVKQSEHKLKNPDLRVASSKNGADNVRIVLTNNANNIHQRASIWMGRGPDGKPDPQSVDGVKITIKGKDTKGETVRWMSYLAAPNADAAGMSLPSTDQHPKGWSAGSQSSVTTPSGEVLTDEGWVYDSSDSDLLAPSGVNPTPSPVDTARSIATVDAPSNFKSVIIH